MATLAAVKTGKCSECKATSRSFNRTMGAQVEINKNRWLHHPATPFATFATSRSHAKAQARAIMNIKLHSLIPHRDCTTRVHPGARWPDIQIRESQRRRLLMDGYVYVTLTE